MWISPHAMYYSLSIISKTRKLALYFLLLLYPWIVCVAIPKVLFSFYFKNGHIPIANSQSVLFLTELAA